MSMWEDYKADTQFERDYQFGIPGDVWHSRDGDIKVSDMSVEHIKNCIKMVGEDSEWHRYFLAVVKERKEERHEDD